jgi:ribose-phosphate pyrophosphokinase
MGQRIYTCVPLTVGKFSNAFSTTGVFSKNAIEIINTGPFNKVVITNSIHHPDISSKSNKIVVLSVANLIGEAIRRTHNEESVSSLFDALTVK